MTTNSSGTSLRNGGVERAFSPFGCSARLTWGVAPGWNETRRWRWGGEWKPPTIVRFWGGGAGGRFVGPVARRDGRVARATLSNFGVRVEAIRCGDHSGVIAKGTKQWTADLGLAGGTPAPLEDLLVKKITRLNLMALGRDISLVSRLFAGATQV